LRRELPEAVAPDAPTPLYRAIDEAMGAFGDEGGEARRVVLVLSDGKDSGPISFRERYVSQGEVIDRARHDDVMVYGIGMRSRGSRPIQPGIGPGGLQAALTADLPDPGLALVAEQTGGGYAEIRFGQDLGTAFAHIADELHSQYLLGFAPPKRDGKVHDIDVRVATRGLKPRARKSYVAPKN
jgi:VWFA-related protein